MPDFFGDPASCRPSGPLLVQRLPGIESLPLRDWHGLGPSEALVAALDGNARLVPGPAGRREIVLGKVFWKAFLRGSSQGGRYILDSIREASRRGTIRELLAGL